MRSEDLKIMELDGGFSVEVTGRANFDYAVPLRDLSGKLAESGSLQIDLSNCDAMDSTFMGVLTMLALKLRKRGEKVVLAGASETLLKLLRDLGVAKLFTFSEAANSADGEDASAKRDMLTTAETVEEAHRALADINPENAEKFKDVIEFTHQDVERLKQQKQ